MAPNGLSSQSLVLVKDKRQGKWRQTATNFEQEEERRGGEREMERRRRRVKRKKRGGTGERARECIQLLYTRCSEKTPTFVFLHNSRKK